MLYELSVKFLYGSVLAACDRFVFKGKDLFICAV